jgi:phage tail sheath protein FI
MMTGYLSSKRPRRGVHTDIAGFVGLAVKGPVVGPPQPIAGYPDFLRLYGGSLEPCPYPHLSSAVEQFFANGGALCYIARVAPEDAATASSPPDAVLAVTAKDPGAWGNDIRIYLTPAHKVKTQILDASAGRQCVLKNNSGIQPGDVMVLVRDGATPLYNRVVQVRKGGAVEFENAFPPDSADNQPLPAAVLRSVNFNMKLQWADYEEVYEYLDFNVRSPNYVEKRLAQSQLVAVSPPRNAAQIIAPVSISLKGGADGSMTALNAAAFIGQDHGPDKRAGIQAFLDNREVSLLAAPGITTPEVHTALIAHCEAMNNRIAILDLPETLTDADDVLAYRDIFDSGFAAIYHPWIQVADPSGRQVRTTPPSGAVAGIIARSDAQHGVQKAPANETVAGCVGLAHSYDPSEQAALYGAGVNLIRHLPDQGIRVWGARTCSNQQDWKYIQICRLFIYLRESIKQMTEWVMFEPNTELLWLKVQRSIDVFLTTLWRDGVLSGGSPSEAFFVKVGRDTMTQEDIAQGRLVCSIGVAPVRPSEFIVFEPIQNTGNMNYA